MSVSSDKKIQLYGGKTGEPSADLPDAHAGSIYSVAVGPDSTQLLTASADKSLKRWEVVEGGASAPTCSHTFIPVESNAQVYVCNILDYLTNVLSVLVIVVDRWATCRCALFTAEVRCVPFL